jgi:hypothetical protein
MLRAYVRLALLVAGLVGAVVLFAFAFTAAAVVVFVTLAVLALFGRRPNVQWWVVREGQGAQWDRPQQERVEPKAPITIDHDPNDLPRN